MSPTHTPPYSRDEKLGTLLRDPQAREVLESHMPELKSLPQRLALGGYPVQLVARTSPALADAAAIEALHAELAALPADAGEADATPEPTPVGAGPAEDTDATGSAEVLYPRELQRFERFEIEFAGPERGNPYVDVELTLQVETPGGSVVVPGFYDGAGVYRARYLVEEPGAHRFTSVSTARSLDGVTGAFEVLPTASGTGPVRVADQFHFEYANGQRHVPVGTTAYAWTHQPDELQEATVRALAESPFNKIRMGIFPKSYIYNENEPARFPFLGGLEEGFDLERFDPEYWSQLEHRIGQLADLGIEADIILFHPYDRWGFADMGQVADDRYLRYAVARLAAFPNIWWSLANEYDLFPAKGEEDWERFAAIVQENDPTGHLLSIHNCFDFYDYSRPWVTHASVQRQDLYKTAEMTGEWREQWGKPVVIDECAYEGDIDQGWGNISGEEMVRRFWEGAVRGGYVGHGETYIRDNDELWWAKGGDLIGSSPERIGFLRQILEEAPAGLEPLNSDWDIPSGGIAGEYLLFYYGFNQPRYRRFVWDPDVSYTVDVIDTWNMTIDHLPEPVSGRFTVDLPGHPYMALRFQAIPSAT